MDGIDLTELTTVLIILMASFTYLLVGILYEETYKDAQLVGVDRMYCVVSLFVAATLASMSLSKFLMLDPNGWAAFGLSCLINFYAIYDVRFWSGK